MPYRYLLGPVSRTFVEQYLQGPCRDGSCVPFDCAADAAVRVAAADTWETLTARLPDGWRPDFLVLYLPYTTIPAGLWAAPVPIVGLAADWNLLWHAYRRQLAACDLILTDPAGVAAFHREGLTQARPATLYGCGQGQLEPAAPEPPRAIDILFVDNLNPAVQRERLAWLGRLARLADRYRVVVRTGVFGNEYHQLVRQARIVFNRSIRGEANQRTFEAAAGGALLFQEAGNHDVAGYFRDRREAVFYTDADLEPLLDYYLEHEEERRTIAAAGQAKAAACTFAALWQRIIQETIEPAWLAMVERAGRRHQPSGLTGLEARTWQHLSSSEEGDPALARDLAQALTTADATDVLHNALGLVTARCHSRAGPLSATDGEAVLGYFQRAWTANPANALAGLNSVECLAALGRNEPALQLARQVLAGLQRQDALDPAASASGHYPPAFDLFRVEWERAAWANAGQLQAERRAKHTLVRWRLHMLLAELTGELAHYHEAALARPDLPVTRAMLGCALARAGHVGTALPHLRQAVEANPFDRDAARALFHALGAVEAQVEQRRLARDRRRLAQAAPQAVPQEDWFAEAPPVGDELASILILCCNQLDYTRQCLASVRQHTRPPYELILVDNGSTDGTAAHLDEVRCWSEPARVEIVTNATNVGYPAGCNQALQRSRGHYVVFLNNDTLVTPGWLEGLIDWSLHEWPRVGLVGAVTNYSRPPQQIPVDYPDPSGRDAFAASRRRAFAGHALTVERLTGFCLLARRDVLDRIGGYDEQFGLGFFDDDDLSVRALQAGFRLLVALDVFIHHFGSRTFTGLGIDCPRQLADNFERFRSKWGPEHAAGYHLPAAAPAPVAVEGQAASVEPERLATRPSVSLCLIVKNEEANLADCLRSAGDLFNEIVVVDTGSTDRTRAIAQQCGAKVFDFPWVDSFAAARNASIEHAAGPWLFWLDADDRLDEANRAKLRSLLQDLGEANVAYSMKCLCLPDPISGTTTVVDHIRLFRKHPAIRWKYRVHEQILPAIRQQDGQVHFADVTIHHTGYQDPALRARKLQRDLRLLELENAEQPDDPFTLFNLGSVYQEQGRMADALTALRRSLERSQPADSIVRKLYALIAQCHRQLDQPAPALAACREGRQYYPDDVELLFHEAQIQRDLGDRSAAEACLLRLLERREGNHFASIDTGLTGYKARHNLALLYQEQGRPAEAEAQWRTAVHEQPGFVAGWLGLGELLLTQQRWRDLEAVMQPLAAVPAAALETVVLQARIQLARREFAAARRQLEEAIQQHPAAVWPRRILSHVLLQEGRDWPAAEQALHALLQLAPNDREARHNLDLLLHHQGRRA